MAYTIMIWNTQHFDNQKGTVSDAYAEKKDFLEYYLSQKQVDIIALFETGKTGEVNEKLINDLSANYTATSTLKQEGGKKKHTTLGSIIFIKNSIAHEFEDVSDLYILSSSEQRAPLIIRHKKSAYGFAFYHSNSSYLASGNIVDTIGFIQDNLENLTLKELLFFGGDMNVPAQSSYEEIKGLKRLAPSDPGYTHVSITNETLGLAAIELKSQQEFGSYVGKKPFDYLNEYKYNQGVEDCVLQETLRLLDYAYVGYANYWSARCDGSIQKKLNNDYETTDIARICLSKKIRSDHFPVLFTFAASFN